ncbi:MAG: AAA family ATPase [Thermodesulfobacteriota bacterium]
MPAHVERLIAELSDPGKYPHAPQSVRVVQTHISVVFIAGDLVYKVKKPVDFGFLDFSTREKRRHFCRQEVLLNSRFSEGLYLGVVPIHEGPDGINLHGKGREIDTAVVMRRVPQDRLLVHLLEDDRVTPELLDRLSDRLAAIHSEAPTSLHIARHGAFEVLRLNLKENFEQTYRHVGRTVDQRTRQEVFNRSMDFLHGHKRLFHDRVSAGHIRDCHGDLHLDHVIIEDGIYLFDCIEFNERFRFCDTASDLSFLLMDMDFRGYPAFSHRISHRYVETSGDREALRLAGFYKSYRAYIRGKVAGFAMDEHEVSLPDKRVAVRSAKHYFALALAYLEAPPPPVLVITVGLMGTGKSYVAEALGTRLGTAPVRSDVIRKELHQIAPELHQFEPFRRGIYGEESTDRTYRAMCEIAEARLIRGEPVILDASFSRREHRDEAFRVAQSAGARFRIVLCTCPESTVRERLTARMGSAGEPSDGRWELFHAQKALFEPPEPLEQRYCRTWDSTSDRNDFLRELVRELMIPD